jgi:hypothetical protein
MSWDVRKPCGSHASLNCAKSTSSAKSANTKLLVHVMYNVAPSLMHMLPSEQPEAQVVKMGNKQTKRKQKFRFRAQKQRGVASGKAVITWRQLVHLAHRVSMTVFALRSKKLNAAIRPRTGKEATAVVPRLNQSHCALFFRTPD